MYKNILVPVSLDQERNTEQALKVAQGLLSDGGQITAIYVDEPIPAFAGSYQPSGFEDRVSNMKTALNKEVSHVPGIKQEVLTGGPGQKIVEYAHDNEMDCIVVASHRPGLADYFLGSTAARVVRHAHCSVHVVR